ncbi:MAG: AAA family ATPase [Oligoflexales bacterium]|nr:AAA family ATPase [Oligoflexales bacterium]
MSIEIKGFKNISEIATNEKFNVFRAIRESDSKAVVLKILRNGQPSARELASVQKEYSIISLFNSDRIVKCFDLTKEGHRPVLVLEDFGGKSLDKLVLGDRGMSLDIFFKISLGVLRSLTDIHEKSVIHKDISPGNILFNSDTGEVKICDFNISVEVSHENSEINRKGALEGTLNYISPEQTGRINCSVDYRSDYYSLGATFFELLTNERLFTADDSIGLIHCHIAKSPRRVDHLNRNIPPVIGDIIDKLLSKSAENRYQSSSGIIHDLERCRDEYDKNGIISRFEIAARDISERFEIPQKLYGRDADLAKIFEVFERSLKGSKEILTVKGFSGVGKSALINELYRSIFEKKGFFIKGKYDQFAKNIPYSAMAQAFSSLSEQLLNENIEKIESIKEDLKKALGPNGQVIVNISENMEKVIGKQPGLEALNPGEAQNRNRNTILDFIKVFARPEHPLVIVLDDLQWADIATLNLIEDMMKDNNLKHFLLIIGYRNNEVKEGDPLKLALDHIADNMKITELLLEPLSEHAVCQIVSDTLHKDLSEVADLSNLIFLKTEGNPFFLNEFFKNLHVEGLVYFDRQKECWNYEIAKIAGVKIIQWIEESSYK